MTDDEPTVEEAEAAIRAWIDEGKVKGATHLLLVSGADEMTGPVFVTEDEDIEVVIEMLGDQYKTVVTAIRLT